MLGSPLLLTELLIRPDEVHFGPGSRRRLGLQLRGSTVLLRRRAALLGLLLRRRRVLLLLWRLLLLRLLRRCARQPRGWSAPALIRSCGSTDQRSE